MKISLRIFFVIIGLLCFWQSLIYLFQLPLYILPSPAEVAIAGYKHITILAQAASTTITETLIGLFLGVILGSIAAIILAFSRPLAYWLLPLLIISQAVPTFAIAPLFVIWFGYGLTSKIATTIVMLFYPITSAFYDGLKQTNPDWLDLAHTMQGTPWRTFWCIKIPAALPSFATGLRVATVIAPIGAVVGEWVGASQGLGYLMLNANARMQIDVMFAALFILVLFSLCLYFIIHYALQRLIPWSHNKTLL